MGFFINAQVGYYEGDRIDVLDREVPQRPDPDVEWDPDMLGDGAWIPKLSPVPESVTPLQARRALLGAGLLSAVQTAANAADDETRLAWEYSSTVERDSPFVAKLALALGLSDAQVDDLFRQAALLT